MRLPHDHVILFDGVCNFCNSTVGFVVRRDPLARFHFLPIQSPLGREVYLSHGHDPEKPDTILLLTGDRALARADAIMEIARHLGFPWSLASAGRLLPRGVRDWLYDRIAHSRYRLFGRSDQCMVPTPELRARFLA